jgi:predicted anti-sigma-YlaC factor YlaD
MKVQKHKGCPDEWLIQAFIDGELEGNDNVSFKQHIPNCSYCQTRVAKRKQMLSDVFTKVDLSESFEIRSKDNRTFNIATWTSIAASILIAITFSFYHFQDKSTITSTDECQWITLNSNEFNPQLESPNRLLQMRVIEIAEVTEKGGTQTVYLIKQCNKK